MSDVAIAENANSVASSPTMSTSASQSQSRSSPGPRLMPSLNQLAARINVQVPSQSSTTSPSNPARQRLPTELLRTSSQMSVVSSAATTDSMAVNAPTTREVSPALSTSTVQSTTSMPSAVGGALLGGDSEITSEKLEKLEDMTEDDRRSSLKAADTIKRSKAPMGYKNVPSLDLITQRMRKARTLSVDGTAMPSPGGSGLPGVSVEELDKIDEYIKHKSLEEEAKAKGEHPLQHPWTLYHDSKPRAQPAGPPGPDQTWIPPPTTATGEYEAQLTVIGEFTTVETFCRYFNWLKPPSMLEKNSNYHLFKEKIKPMWEDEANSNGGKWVLTMRNNPQLLDRTWSYLTMAMIGEELDEGDDICGAVVSLRSKVDRIQLWTRNKTDVDKLNGLARKMINLLQITEADNVGLEFQYNSEDHPPPNRFISMSSTFAFPNSGTRSTFTPNANQPNPAGGRHMDPQQQGGMAGGRGGAFGGGAFGWRKS